MRFVLAIAAFVVAAAMIVFGIAQRTVFLPPAAVSYEVSVKGDLPYTVIDGAVLNALDGKQSVTVTGSDTVFVAYGRTADVLAWIGDDPYATVEFDDTGEELVSQTVVPEATDDGGTDDSNADDSGAGDSGAGDEGDDAVTANPEGSDLWLSETVEDTAVIAPMSVPDDVSVIIASDGTQPAPASVKLTWPADNSTPWAGPLIVGGILMLLVGLALYLLGINHMRRSRGPRRKGIDGGQRRFRVRRGPRPVTVSKRKQIGSLRVAAVPTLLVGSLLLGGCSQAFWPDFTPDESATETPTPTATTDAGSELPSPVVSTAQLERIVSRISTVAAQADEDRDSDLASTRFTGAALTERETNYAIRGSIADYAATAAIPASPLTITLPQATESWPRSVFTIITDEDDETVAPTALMLTQESPRENYKIAYSVRLEADAVTPDLAPAYIGATSFALDSPFLLLQPDQVAAAYADILASGEESEYGDAFDLTDDALLGAITASRQKTSDDLPDTASIEFSSSAGDSSVLSLSTNDSGAIVAVDMNEVETVKPVEDGAVVKLQGAVAALVGVDETSTGATTTYIDQLLFYVPPADSDEKIVLLGFSQGIQSASEIE